jgi:hypothetical protein
LLAGEAAGGVSRPTLVLYPMKCPNRAAERRPEVIQVLRQAGYDRVIDMSGHEKRDKSYFEGTGGKGLCICMECCVRRLRCDTGTAQCADERELAHARDITALFPMSGSWVLPSTHGSDEDGGTCCDACSITIMWVNTSAFFPSSALVTAPTPN